MSEAIRWRYRVTEVPERGLRQTRAATEAECGDLARALDIGGCQKLTCTFTIRSIGDGRYRLAGDLDAEVVQACVITLEPLQQKVKSDFDVAFWPATTISSPGEEEVEALGAAEIEPIEHGEIDVGRIVFETLSAAIDPYPRKPGAAFESEDAAGLSGPATAGPFASLKKLKDPG